MALTVDDKPIIQAAVAAALDADAARVKGITSNERLLQILRDGAGAAMATQAGVAQLLAATPSAGTDAAEVAKAVLAGLTPQAIADALDDSIATEVVDLLAARLSS
jgi:hypothetical protein